ncbi:hypothetical protein GIB67_040455 [Kingdonia uniflora]|uniref:Uncharacterized protein n=1 Tax=Kingdonia uniflora TaxID=39325 RepID=A0A7J7L565_9MAGN|nr:hypothetical protein GIB67_040455 [Kingdonia uniflora]
MRSLVFLGIGLGLVLGLCFIGLVAELYYLLWWKKRVTNKDIEEDSSTSSSREIREISYLLCWRKPSSLSLTTTALDPQVQDVQIELINPNSDKDFVAKPFGEEDASIERELMRLHGLSGPTRLLFTIKEETKEDLESEDGRSITHKSKCLNDFLVAVDTPFLTPMPSPIPLSPMESYKQQGFNPLYESSSNIEMSKIKSSPPPKFKFLLEAEEKLYRKTLIEEAGKKLHPLLPQYSHSSTPSQVLPLASSPYNVHPN